MATIGAVIGGYITYSLARKGGKETLERKLSKRGPLRSTRDLSAGDFMPSRFRQSCRRLFRLFRFCWRRERCNIPRKKFLPALTFGRAVRYTIIAGLGAIYGSQIVAIFFPILQAGTWHSDWLAVVGAVLRWSNITGIRARPGTAAASERVRGQARHQAESVWH